MVCDPRINTLPQNPDSDVAETTPTYTRQKISPAPVSHTSDHSPNSLDLLNPLIQSNSTNNLLNQILILDDKIASKHAQNVTLTSTLSQERESFEQRIYRMKTKMTALMMNATPSSFVSAETSTLMTAQRERIYNDSAAALHCQAF